MNSRQPQSRPSADDIRRVLEASLSGAPGGRGPLTILDRRPSAYRTSYALEEIDVQLGDRSLTLLFKDLSRHSLHESARNAKPAFVHDPLREIVVYRTLLPQAPAGTARCYGALAEEHEGRFWLFLEKVAGVELYQVGELGLWQQTARWLAGFHQSLLDECDRAGVRPHLISYDNEYYRRWLERARAFADPLEASRMQMLAKLERRLDDVLAGVAASPRGFLHGELYASNVLVDATSLVPRICPIDWEMAGCGPVLLDLAALTSGDWRDADREAIALAYYEAAGGSLLMPRATFITALACCHVLMALQWLGWASDWLPPKEHRRDWVAEMGYWLDRI